MESNIELNEMAAGSDNQEVEMRTTGEEIDDMEVGAKSIDAGSDNASPVAKVEPMEDAIWAGEEISNDENDDKEAVVEDGAVNASSSENQCGQAGTKTHEVANDVINETDGALKDSAVDDTCEAMEQCKAQCVSDTVKEETLENLGDHAEEIQAPSVGDATKVQTLENFGDTAEEMQPRSVSDAAKEISCEDVSDDAMEQVDDAVEAHQTDSASVAAKENAIQSTQGDEIISFEPNSGKKEDKPALSLQDANIKASSNMTVSKAVALHDTEEGELDYEEEEITDTTQHHHEDQEEGEIMDDKDAEGSEEGEIVSDEDDQQDCSKKTEKEEGEVNDDDLEEGQLDEELERGHRPRTLCKYYDAGTCRWGVSCRFLHPGINDKGNYLMHRPPGMYPTAFGKPPPPSEISPISSVMARGPIFATLDPPPIAMDVDRVPAPAKESAWERGLKKAKEIKLKSQKRREEDEQFDEKRMNLSLKEFQKEQDRPVTASRREQWRPPGFERDSQPDKYSQRNSRQADIRHQEANNERRFGRNRKSPPRRYDVDRDKGSRVHEADREKPRDMDRERFVRMHRRRSFTPPERRREKEKDRNRERDKPDSKRDRGTGPSSDVPTGKDKVTTPLMEENKVKAKEDVGNEKKSEELSVGAPRALEAEQWRDPWMRTQSAPIVKSPERKLPSLLATSLDEIIASGDSSVSDSDSDSDESDESGSGSDSESKASSDENAQKAGVKEVAKPSSVAAPIKEPRVATSASAPIKDPRLKTAPSKDSAPKRDLPQQQPQKDRVSGRMADRKMDKTAPYPQRPNRDPRDYDRRPRPDEFMDRRGRDRVDERDRRYRDRRDGYGQNANQFPPWNDARQADSSWQRGGYNSPFMNAGYRGMPDRPTDSRRPEGDPRLWKGERERGGRRNSPVRSPHEPAYSRKPAGGVRDPRRRPQSVNMTGDKDRKQPSQDAKEPSPAKEKRRHSPKQKDPRIRNSSMDGLNRSDDNKGTKESAGKGDRSVPPKDKRVDAKPEPVIQQAKKTVEKSAVVPKETSTTTTTTFIQSDISEDEFQSPKYAESVSDSDSDSDTGSESDESESEVESEAGNASPSENELSNSDSDDSDSEKQSSSDEENVVSSLTKKVAEKKKKATKMSPSMVKTLSSSDKVAKSQTLRNDNSFSNRSDTKLQTGQKRSLSARNSSTAVSKTSASKTVSRKDELLKELKAIEDAIARKRAKIE
eukprot:gene18695-20583_t